MARFNLTCARCSVVVATAAAPALPAGSGVLLRRMGDVADIVAAFTGANPDGRALSQTFNILCTTCTDGAHTHGQ